MSDSKRQIETAGTVARVLRLLLTKHKEKQQRQAIKTSDQSSNGELLTLSLGVNDAISSKSSNRDKSASEQSVIGHTDGLSHDDEDDLSLQHALPDVIQACRSSRLQLISLAPHLLEESAHTSNSDVRSRSVIGSTSSLQQTVQVSACASACLHVIQELSVLLETAVSARRCIVCSMCFDHFFRIKKCTVFHRI